MLTAMWMPLSTVVMDESLEAIAMPLHTVGQICPELLSLLSIALVAVSTLGLHEIDQISAMRVQCHLLCHQPPD